MFKRFMVWAMMFSLLMTHAEAAPSVGLQEAFEEFNFALGVEWDQQDEAFHDRQVELFSARLKDLRSQGLSSQDLIDFTLSRIQERRLAQELRSVLELARLGEVDASGVETLVAKAALRSGSAGASWNGGLTAVKVISISVAVLGAVLIAKELIRRATEVRIE